MITVKDYAAQKGVTERAVYKQLKSKRNAERLKNHIQIIDGKQWLDEEAVAILNESRNHSPVIFVQENKDQKIEELENTIKQMLVRENSLQREISDMSKELAAAYKREAEAAALIEQGRASMKLLEATEAKAKETEDKLHLAEQRADQLQEQLEAEKKKTFLQRLFGK